MFDEDIKKDIIKLAKDGLILPVCPSCNIVLSLKDEVLKESCKNCGAALLFDLVFWISTDTIAQA